MHRTRIILVMLLVGAPARMSAQRNSGAHFSGVPGARIGASAPHFGANFGGARFSSPLALASGAYYDALLDAGYPVAAQPPVIVVQPGIMQSADARRETFSSPTQPLMIELQGDHYVRVSGAESSGAEMIDREIEPRSNLPESPQRSEMPPAILIFRDGHREEISDYAITDGVLYTSGNSYKGGSWTRAIQISSLNLSETVESNQARGVRFELPTAPNVVMVRP
jgi:hypothetical protein